ncbi:hypothetical protein AMS68_007810 [Peltaster fructicola]|uniref:Enoyl reductase (ER) domain-containing protein n=1 Tax=Peltaster fructicola TaxID=286661 RepID=A0A6H0Y5L4_9PEZI|nr:hypothetical protein AMS68_007810 [Peltaster fructicola]
MFHTILQQKPKNIAISATPDHHIDVSEVPMPTPCPDECLIHIRATGICGSDVHMWKDGHIGDSFLTENCGLGHESAGIVIGTGANVQHLSIDVVFFSAPPIDGTLRRYHVHPAAWLHKLPDGMSLEEGALLEPLSVALAGIDRANLRLGDPLLICGAGPIGMITLLAAHAAGAAPIAITDIDEHRLSVARMLVPRVRTVHVKPGQEPKGIAEDVKRVLDCEAKLVLECTGVESSVHSGIYAAKFGGSVFIIGVGRPMQTIPFMHASFREIDVRFQFRYHETYPKAIRLVAEGLIDLKPLVTHRFCLEEGKAAFEAASTPAAKAIKVQLID